MAEVYKHKEVVFLVSLMIIFTLVFFLGYSSYKTNTAIINIGIEAQIIDWVVMLFCIAAIGRIVMLIKDIEIKRPRANK